MTVKDLTYDPDIDSHYSEASNKRMAALVERLKTVIAKAREAKAQAAKLEKSRPLPSGDDAPPALYSD